MWSLENSQTLALRWNEGAPVRVIAKELKTTKDAVRQRSRRLNLARRGQIKWSSELEERLRTMFESGCTAGVIAKELGLTRNAVIGKCNRIGLKRGRIVATRSLREGNQNRTGKRRKPRLWRPETGEIVEVKRADFLGIPFEELKRDHCRYPSGEGLSATYCGQPKMQDSSYCAWCHSVCYQRRAA